MSPHTAPVSVLIVDDEVHGRDVVRHMLQQHTDFHIVGEAANGVRALEEIRTKHPQLVFLDIKMPKLSGIDLISALDQDRPPAIVFVTAYDQYAVEAFERCAFDYLLKPFDQARFDRALDRVRERFRTTSEAEFGRRLREVLTVHSSLHQVAPAQPVAEAPAKVQRLTRFVIKDAGRVFFIPVEEADWLEASGNYVGVHVGSKTHLVHDTLAKVEESLDPAHFLRIHRSTIVNVSRIKELQPFTNSEFVVILQDGTRLKLSRSFRDRANEILGLR